VDDEPREGEVKRRSAAFRDHGVQHVRERAPADEERKRLVLMRRPGTQEPAEHSGERGGHDAGPEPEDLRLAHPHAGAPEGRGELDQRLSLCAVKADTTASVLHLVPTYEYKCPNGHVFEVFKRIADPQPEKCPVCGASPVETVLYPVPVHFRGSGFYSTDYGRGGKKKEPAKESSDSGSGGDKKDTGTEKKAAEAG
jgi:putative FmdB family regulatory protein